MNEPALMDRSYLFGILAVQLGFSRPEAVMGAASAWLTDPSRTVADRLVINGDLTEQQRGLLDGIVDQSIRAHGGDARQTLVSFGGDRAVLRSFGGSMLPHSNPADTESDPADPPEAGHVTPEELGRYDFGNEDGEVELGRGGIGRVLLAMDTHLGREVAVKQLLVDHASAMSGTPGTDPLTATSAAVVRFLREARVTGQLEHPGIVPVHELGRRANGAYYYTMKAVRGHTLAAVLEDCGAFADRAKLLSHFTELCHAIAYAHSRGVIHRDIKPENVMLGEFGETVVLDWGLAKVKGKRDLGGSKIEHDLKLLQGSDTAKTVDGSVLGTPAYMSPEQANGNVDDIDERSDVWCLGAVLYQVLTGRPPFQGVSPYEIIGKVLKDDVQPPRKVDAAVPAELEAVAMKALRRNKADRYPCASDIARELDAYLTGGRIQAYSYSSWELLAGFVKQHKAVTASILAVFSIAVASAFVLYGAYREADGQRRRAEQNEAVARQNELDANHNLAISLRDRAHHLLESGDVLGARIFAAASLLHNPTNPRSPHFDVSAKTYDGGHSLHVDAYSLYAQSKLSAQFVADGVLKHDDKVLAVRFSPDGRRVATAGADNVLSLWDVDTGQRVTSTKPLDAPAATLVFSPDAATLASGHADGSVKLWSAKELTPIGSEKWHESSVREVLFVAQPSRILSASLNGRVTFFDVENRKLQEILPSKVVGRVVAFAPNGSMIAAQDPNVVQQVSLWDGRGRLVERLTVPIRFIGDMEFSPDGHRLVIAGTDPSDVWIWNIPDRQFDGTVSGDTETNAVAFSPAGDTLAMAGVSTTWKLISADSLMTMQRLGGHIETIRQVAIAPNGDKVATASHDKTVRLWRRPNSELARRRESRDSRWYVSYSPDGKTIAAAGPQPEVLDRSSMTVLHGLGNHSCVGIDYAPDGETIATGGRDGSVRTWDARTGDPLANLGSHGDYYVRHVDYSPDGKLLASGSWSSVMVWDVEKGQRKHRLKAGGGVAFSPDGRTLAAGAPDGVVLFDPHEGKETRRLDWSASTIDDVRYSNRGRWLAASSQQGKVRLWDLRASQEGEAAFDLLDHPVWVNQVSFSPDESLLVTAGDDSRVRVWSLDSREPILVFRTPEPCIGAVFSNDGGELALASGRLLQFFPLDFSARDADPNALLNSAQKDAALRLRAFALEPLEP